MDEKLRRMKKMKILYEYIYRSYYLQTILNKGLQGYGDLNSIEIGTLSLLCQRYLNSAIKLAMRMTES